MKMPAYIDHVLPTKMLKGRRCFILGGGPSLASVDLNLLVDEFIIGVNKSFVFEPDINYSMDKRFEDLMITATQDKLNEELYRMGSHWKRWEGRKVFLETVDRKFFADNILIVKRSFDPKVSLDIKQGIYSGKDSGFGAIMLAIALGANPIYLLGYDMKTDIKNARTHWHEGYEGQAPRKLQHRLNEFKEVYVEFAPKIVNAGVQIINLTEGSALECFEKDNMYNIIK